MCSDQVRLLDIVTPKYLTELLGGGMGWLVLILVGLRESRSVIGKKLCFGRVRFRPFDVIHSRILSTSCYSLDASLSYRFR